MKRILIMLMFGVTRMACANCRNDKSVPQSSARDDPYLWLEDITGEKALSRV